MIRLHHVPQSRSMRTLWLLLELGVDFEIRTWPFDKTLRSPEYKALNPVGRVPALEIDGTAIWETGAITQALCDRFSPDGLGRSAGHAERDDWLIWLHFAETVSQHTANLTQQHVVLYEDHMRSPLLMKLEAARVGKCFDAIETRLHGRDWLLDGGFCAADVSIGQAIYMARHFHKIGERPAMQAWWDRIEARPAFVAARPHDGETRLYTRDYYEAPDAG